jgi:hypothetical protein
MSNEIAGRKYYCERCDEVTREEIEKCPQNGCPVRKVLESPFRDAALASAVEIENPFGPKANPYAFASNAPPVDSIERPGNKLVYSIIGLYLTSFVIALVALFSMNVRMQNGQPVLRGFGIETGLLAIVLPLNLAPWILLQIWLYRTWSIIPKDQGGINPVLVILLQLIPCFNLYWWYRIMPGLSVVLGNLRKEQEPDSDDQAGFWFAISGFVVFIVGAYAPGIMILFPVLFAMWLILANRAKNRYLELRLGIRTIQSNSK